MQLFINVFFSFIFILLLARFLSDLRMNYYQQAVIATLFYQTGKERSKYSLFKCYLACHNSPIWLCVNTTWRWGQSSASSLRLQADKRWKTGQVSPGPCAWSAPATPEHTIHTIVWHWLQRNDIVFAGKMTLWRIIILYKDDFIFKQNHKLLWFQTWSEGRWAPP